MGQPRARRAAACLAAGLALAGCTASNQVVRGAPSPTPTSVGDWTPLPTPTTTPTVTPSAPFITLVPPSPVVGKLTLTPAQGAPGTSVRIAGSCPATGKVALYSGPFTAAGATVEGGHPTWRTSAGGAFAVTVAVGGSSAPKTGGPVIVALLCSPDSSSVLPELLSVPNTFFYVLG